MAGISLTVPATTPIIRKWDGCLIFDLDVDLGATPYARDNIVMHGDRESVLALGRAIVAACEVEAS